MNATDALHDCQRMAVALWGKNAIAYVLTETHMPGFCTAAVFNGDEELIDGVIVPRAVRREYTCSAAIQGLWNDLKVEMRRAREVKP